MTFVFAFQLNVNGRIGVRVPKNVDLESKNAKESGSKIVLSLYYRRNNAVTGPVVRSEDR